MNRPYGGERQSGFYQAPSPVRESGFQSGGYAVLEPLTTTQRDALTSPGAGRTIYNTTTNKINFYNGAAWEVVTSV